MVLQQQQLISCEILRFTVFNNESESRGKTEGKRR